MSIPNRATRGNGGAGLAGVPSLATAAMDALAERRRRDPAAARQAAHEAARRRAERRARQLGRLRECIERATDRLAVADTIVWRQALDVPDDWERDEAPYGLVDGRIWMAAAPGWRVYLGAVRPGVGLAPEAAWWWRRPDGGLRTAAELADLAEFLIDAAAAAGREMDGEVVG